MRTVFDDPMECPLDYDPRRYWREEGIVLDDPELEDEDEAAEPS